MPQRFRFVMLGLAGALFASPAAAYPVSGKWTYDNPDTAGPAVECGRRYMNFAGGRRFDTGGSIRDYRNVRIEPLGATEFRIVDEFFNGQTRGRMLYVLKLRDADHIALQTRGGTIRLRRCA
jgi:hypothetical protein